MSYKYRIRDILKAYREDFDTLLSDIIEVAEEEGLPLSEQMIEILEGMKNESD